MFLFQFSALDLHSQGLASKSETSKVAQTGSPVTVTVSLLCTGIDLCLDFGLEIGHPLRIVAADIISLPTEWPPKLPSRFSPCLCGTNAQQKSNVCSCQWNSCRASVRVIVFVVAVVAVVVFSCHLDF